MIEGRLAMFFVPQRGMVPYVVAGDDWLGERHEIESGDLLEIVQDKDVVFDGVVKLVGAAGGPPQAGVFIKASGLKMGAVQREVEPSEWARFFCDGCNATLGKRRVKKAANTA